MHTEFTVPVASPGECIQKVLDEYNASTRDLARAMGVSESAVDKLLAGELFLDLTLAKKLSIVLSGSVEHWLKLEANYRGYLARILRTVPLI